MHSSYFVLTSSISIVKHGTFFLVNLIFSDDTVVVLILFITPAKASENGIMKS